MSTSIQLKQEINQTLSELHDFAKWKLIAVSALAAVGLGISHAGPSIPYWLLFFAPFACAYVDLHSYQYLLRIFALAKALREHADDQLLQDYELLCERLRAKGYFGIGMYAQLGSSIGFSILLPGFALAMFLQQYGVSSAFFWIAGVIWLVGLMSILGFASMFNRKIRLIDDD